MSEDDVINLEGPWWRSNYNKTNNTDFWGLKTPVLQAGNSLCDLRRKVVLTPAFTKGELKQGVTLLLRKHRSLVCLVVTLFTQFSQTVLLVVLRMRQCPLPWYGSTILYVDLCLSPGLHTDLSLWTFCYWLPILLPHPASMHWLLAFPLFLGKPGPSLAKHY